MHEYETGILKLLKEKRSLDPEGIEKALGIDAGAVMWALDNLSTSGAVKLSRSKSYDISITKEGEGYLGAFPEEALLKLLKKGGQAKLKDIDNNIGLIWARKNEWVVVEGGSVRLTKDGTAAAAAGSYKQRALLGEIAKAGQDSLGGILDKNKADVDTLIKRGLLRVKEKDKISKVEITEKGLGLSSAKAEDGIGELTREIIINRRWSGKSFKRYDVNASSEVLYPARQHVMHEFIDTVREAWLSMGFSEVDGPIIESAFWNFDALFSPQDHPTREMQDTFFLSNPKQIDIEDMEVLGRIKKEHVEGWKEEWKEEIAKQALLRTHTTNVSVRHIRKFAAVLESSYPIKLFSVGKVFRNESIDYNHLAELYQVDGIVIGNNLTFANLIDTLKRFYSQLGFEDVKVKPAYFPFVEPGLELNYYDRKRDSMMELCGAGIIRKEITRAMGTNKTVLAWGGGLDRLLMLALGVPLITDLYKNDIGWLRSRPELEV